MIHLSKMVIPSHEIHVYLWKSVVLPCVQHLRRAMSRKNHFVKIAKIKKKFNVNCNKGRSIFVYVYIHNICISLQFLWNFFYFTFFFMWPSFDATHVGTNCMHRINDTCWVWGKNSKNLQLLDIQACNSAKRWFISWITGQIADLCYFCLISIKYP